MEGGGRRGAYSNPIIEQWWEGARKEGRQGALSLYSPPSAGKQSGVGPHSLPPLRPSFLLSVVFTALR